MLKLITRIILDILRAIIASLLFYVITKNVDATFYFALIFCILNIIGTTINVIREDNIEGIDTNE